MMTISDNDLKIHGISALKKALAHGTAASVSVHGKSEYIVMRVKEYNRIREQEILHTCEQAKKDIKTGHFHTGLKKHLKMVGCV